MLCPSTFSAVTVGHGAGAWVKLQAPGHPGRRAGEEEKALGRPGLLQVLPWWPEPQTSKVFLGRPLCRRSRQGRAWGCFTLLLQVVSALLSPELVLQ